MLKTKTKKKLKKNTPHPPPSSSLKKIVVKTKTNSKLKEFNLSSSIALELIDVRKGVVRTDGENGVIYGAKVITRGPFKDGRGYCDNVFLQQITDAGNAAGERGVDMYYGHHVTDDNLGYLTAKAKNFRIVSDSVLADIYFLSIASKSPAGGDLPDYLMSMAESPDLNKKFGLSIFGLRNLQEEQNFIVSNNGSSPEVDNVDELRHWRLAELLSVDFTGSPNANVGLLSKTENIEEDKRNILSNKDNININNKIMKETENNTIMENQKTITLSADELNKSITDNIKNFFKTFFLEEEDKPVEEVEEVEEDEVLEVEEEEEEEDSENTDSTEDVEEEVLETEEDVEDDEEVEEEDDPEMGMSSSFKSLDLDGLKTNYPTVYATLSEKVKDEVYDKYKSDGLKQEKNRVINVLTELKSFPNINKENSVSVIDKCIAYLNQPLDDKDIIIALQRDYLTTVRDNKVPAIKTIDPEKEHVELDHITLAKKIKAEKPEITMTEAMVLAYDRLNK